MKEYLGLLSDIIEHGHNHSDRTGTGRRSVFAKQIRLNMDKGFPLVTTRKVFTKALIEELLWFISGSTNVKLLNEKGVHIWDKWAVSEEDIEAYLDMNKGNYAVDKYALRGHLGEIGPMYGYCWRHAGRQFVTNEKGRIVEESIDQLANLVKSLKETPYSSRHIVTAWLPEYIPATEKNKPQYNVFIRQGCLAPCHMMFQCFVDGEGDDKRLSMHMYQRSADVPIGVPYNIAQYALLLHMLAQVTHMKPYELIITFGDTHIYLDQIELVKQQLLRSPRPLPELVLNPDIDDLFKFKSEDITIKNYDPHPAIAYPISV